VITISLNHHILKTAHGSNILAISTLCARASRVIPNHAPIGGYRLRFFFREDFSCSYGLYPIETRQHILYECRRFNKYWNPRRDLISHFIMFPESNPNVFAFSNPIT